MQAIGRLVRDHSPDVIFFQVTPKITTVLYWLNCFISIRNPYLTINWFDDQEVTAYILQIFKSTAWFKQYCYYYSPVSVEPVDKNFYMMVISLPLPPFGILQIF
jgi:hypothetical protein